MLLLSLASNVLDLISDVLIFRLNWETQDGKRGIMKKSSMQELQRNVKIYEKML